jgi:hypothetical protein
MAHRGAVARASLRSSVMSGASNISASATDAAARRIVWHSPTRDGSRRARRGSFVSRVVRKAYEQREA